MQQWIPYQKKESKLKYKMKLIPRIIRITAKKRSLKEYMSLRIRNRILTAKYVTLGSTIKRLGKNITRPKSMQRLRSFSRHSLRQKKKRML